MSYSTDVNNNTTITATEKPSQFLDSLYKLTFVSISSILENKAPFVIFESSDFFLVDGPIIRSKMKQYFIAISRHNMKIVGFMTLEDNPKRLEKIKMTIDKIKTVVGKDGRKFYDALLHDISMRSEEQYVFDANFYDFSNKFDDRFIDEEITRQELRDCTTYVEIK